MNSIFGGKRSYHFETHTKQAALLLFNVLA
jgi:hypothetical protein